MIAAAGAPARPTPPPARSNVTKAGRGVLIGGSAAAVFVCLGLAALAAVALVLAGPDLAGLIAPPPTATPLPTETPTSVPTATAPPASLPTRTPLPPATPLGAPGEVLFQDGFDDTGSGWRRMADDGGSTEYGQGVFVIHVDETYTDYVSISGHDFANVRLSVSGTKAGGPDDNDFGVVCRYQDDENYYALLVTSDGYYGILKMKEGRRTMIGQDDNSYLSSPVIHQGEATNEIVAECRGDHLALHVNGELVADERDGAFASGDVGLIAGTFGEGGVEIQFDDFAAYRP